MRKELIDVTEAMRAAGTTRTTLISWCRKYTVDGEPLGVKVGGRWQVYSDRLARFLDGGGRVEGEKDGA